MTACACYFTWGMDAPLLEESAAIWRERFPGLPLAICDDGASPVDPAVVGRIAPDHYEQSTWPRRRNLNGAAAVAGVLDFEATMSESFECGTLKLDSDTACWDLGWIKPGALLCGFDGGGKPVAVGCCRFLDAGVSASLLAAVQRRSFWPAARLEEDATITLEALWEFGPGRLVVWPWTARLLRGWHYAPASTAAGMDGAATITFGNFGEMGAMNPAARRRVAAAAMQTVRERRAGTLRGAAV